MPPRKSKRQLADEAYLRSMEALDGRAPVPAGTLPGQIDLVDGAVAGTDDRGADAILDGIPEQCPRCQRAQTLALGWTCATRYCVGCLRPERDHPHFECATFEPPSAQYVQCGNCGMQVAVRRGAWETLRLALTARFGASDRAPIPKHNLRGDRPRGAG